MMRISTPFLIFFFLSALVHAQSKTCDIKVDVSSGCVPQPVNFTPILSDTTNISSYYWAFDDGTSASTKKTSHIYNKSGLYKPSLVVYYKDGSFCQVQLSESIHIYSKPTADFIPGEGLIILCYPGEQICFKDLSKPGIEGSPVRAWYWTFGDGGFSKDRAPCYSYNDSGIYNVTLEVTDTNGCRSTIMQKKLQVRFSTEHQQMKPKFRVDYSYDCTKNEVSLQFFNQTDTANSGITSFKWNYDDGNTDSCDLKDPACKDMWEYRKHLYQIEGEYTPKLTVYNKYGCSMTYEIDTPVELFHYYFDVKVDPEFICFQQAPSAFFDVTGYLPSNTRYYWDMDGDSVWDAFVPYVYIKKWQNFRPAGVYSVHLRLEYNNCVFDTIMCNKIKAFDTYAKIIKEPDGTPQRTPRDGSWLVKPADYPNYFDTSCQAPDSMLYYTYDSVYVLDARRKLLWCGKNPDIDTFHHHTYDCKLQKHTRVVNVVVPDTVYENAIVVKAEKYYWKPGNPWPVGHIYSDPPFYEDTLWMNDTDLVAPSCSAPKEIKFTNFSGKDRGYFAYDNNALEYDTCLNPAYPYATDSLEYYWTFKEGNGQTSGPGAPVEDKRASYSKLKTPTHLFLKDGCYWVRLNVVDKVTGCADVDSVPIVLQGADAGWAPDYSNVDNMTWLLQEKLPAPPGGPRRGFRLEGRPCVGDTQYIVLDETLPSCYKVDFAIVLDSNTLTKDKCSPNGLSPKWNSKGQIEDAGYKVFYNDSGWRTVALAVKNNENCVDTVWYYNYKYFHDVNSSIYTDKVNYCLGDILELSMAQPEQAGIQYMAVKYIFTKTKFDTLEVRRDTFGYEVHNIGGDIDTITSTVHNVDWGKDDGNLNFSYLYDTLKTSLDHPGHLYIKTKIYNRFGCRDSSLQEVAIGLNTAFESDVQIPCLGDTVSFRETIKYHLKYDQSPDQLGYDTILYWQDPLAARNGRVPLLAEKVEWDLDGDSVVDVSGSEPKWAYTKPGSYTIRMFVTDSNGCRQVIEKKDYINVISVQAKFVVDSPGANRFCAPHFYHFLDSSTIFPDKVTSIVQWIWDFGDGSPPLIITDPSKKSPVHLYENNGVYTVTLKVKSSDATGAKKHGCTDSFSMTFTIKGPAPEFAVIGEMEGCAPFTLKLVDKGNKAALKEWYLGDGKVLRSENEDTVYLTYTKPGEYCPYLVAVDTIKTIQGDTLYCIDTFPKPACKYKVVVHPLDKINITVNDTVLCVDNDEFVLKISPDTGYTAWEIDYGDGRKEQNDKPVFKTFYSRTGNYRVRVTGINGRCPDTAYVNVRVVDVKADFEIDEMNIDTPFFNFINTSHNGVKYIWSFTDGSKDFETKEKKDLLHEFMDVGEQTVCLTAYNAEGCSHKTCKKVNLIASLFIPNVFTPDNDPQHYNEKFIIDIVGELDYGLKIFNRWGELVFESDSKYENWDGTNRHTGAIYPTGTYYFVFRYRLIGGKDEVYKGTVTLLR